MTKMSFLDPDWIGNGIFSPSAGASLTDGLLWYYTLEEATGSRADSGPNLLTLSENGTVGNGPGVISNAADFPGINDNNLAHVFDSVYDLSSTDFTITLWANLTNLTSRRTFLYIGEGNPSSSDVAVLIEYRDNTDTIQFRIGSGTSNINARQDIGGSIPASEFIFVVCRWDTLTQTLEISLNNGSFDVVAAGFGIQNTGTQQFRLGTLVDGGNPHLGLVDEVGGWNRKLTESEINFLYNNGNGGRPVFDFTVYHDSEMVVFRGDTVLKTP